MSGFDTGIAGHVWGKSSTRDQQGEPLITHLNETMQSAEKIALRNGNIENLGFDLWKHVRLASAMHDIGKITESFQDMLRGGPGTGQRHEVLSVAALPRMNLEEHDYNPDLVALAILCHHRPLAVTPYKTASDDYKASKTILRLYNPTDLRDINSLQEKFPNILLKEFNTIVGHIASVFNLSYNPYLNTEEIHTELSKYLVKLMIKSYGDGIWPGELEGQFALQAALTLGGVVLADRVASSKTTYQTDTFVQQMVAPFKEYELFQHQTHASNTTGHMVLRSPTGSGKTEAGLLWAAHNIKNHNKHVNSNGPVLHYVLPFLASIRAMSRRIENLPAMSNNVGIVHSKATQYYYSKESCDSVWDAKSQANGARLWNQTVSVSTPYSIIQAAAKTPSGSAVLTTMSNSVVILDEIHAYDIVKSGAIVANLVLWEKLGAKFGLVSATLPQRFVNFLFSKLQNSYTDIKANPEFFERSTRHLLKVLDNDLTSYLPKIVEEANSGKNVLVVANEVRKAKAIAAELEKQFDPSKISILHSRFRHKDRNLKEQKLAKFANKNVQTQGEICVATQVVEVSLDVDFNCMFTELAPLDALAQRFGRVNRSGSRPAETVHVCIPSEPSKVYDQELVGLTKKELLDLSGSPFNENELQEIIDKIYESKWGDNWEKEMEDAYNGMKNWVTPESFLYYNPDANKTFEEMFKGAEILWEDDVSSYDNLVSQYKIIEANELLIPVPDRTLQWADYSYDKARKIIIMRGSYDVHSGFEPAQKGKAPLTDPIESAEGVIL